MGKGFTQQLLDGVIRTGILRELWYTASMRTFVLNQREPTFTAQKTVKRETYTIATRQSLAWIRIIIQMIVAMVADTRVTYK